MIRHKLILQIAGYLWVRIFWDGVYHPPHPKKKNHQGQLLTSDNYDDNEKKVVGGRNGQGPEIWKKWPDMVSLGEDIFACMVGSKEAELRKGTFLLKRK